ncbi:MAG: biopolymer transporter ExbD [Kofleriaceae bacterium]
MIRRAVARVPEGENITHLNIMPMMDMMTILLVAFIFQLSTNALDVIAGTVSLPKTEIDAPLPEKSWTLVITQTGVVVEGQAIVSVANGDVDPAEKDGGSQGIKIPRLSNYLANLRGQEIKKLQEDGKDPSKEKPPELLLIADRTTPYRLLLEVMYSAKTKEAGFKHFRLIVQKNFPVRPAAP